METMTTVSEVLNVLKKRGYTVDFNLDENCLVCQGNLLQVLPNEFVVDKHYRFEGISDPADEAVVYAISSEKHNIKGTFVDGYGIYSDKMTDEMIEALKEKREDIKMPTTADPSSNSSDSPSSDPPSDQEVKANEATPLRPEGDRLLNAQMVLMDLNAFKEQIKDEKAWKEGDRNAITIFKSDEMRIVLIALHEGCEMKPHTAPGIISVQVLEGNITFRTEQRTTDLSEGQMLTLHKEIPHSVHANREATFLLTLVTPYLKQIIAPVAP